jgi:putative SOS response-associated peptidase YedK
VPSNNIAPLERVEAVRVAPGGKERELVKLSWGLIFPGTEVRDGCFRMVAQEAETIVREPSWQPAMRLRRCLIPAHGYFAWHQYDCNKPFYFRLVRGRLFAFAALWERWSHPRYEPVDCFLILTTRANALVRPVDERMPVIVDRTDFDQWLDPAARLKAVQALLRPYPPERMRGYPVSS